ncbi:Cytosolic sulfotransferase 5 [Linum perenne]
MSTVNNKQLIPTNKQVLFWGAYEMCQVEGFWYPTNIINSINNFRANFKPKRDDVVVLASSMKTGTTWLKALSHSILFRDEEDLLTKMNPHLCVPTLESRVYSPDPSGPHIDHDECRLFSTHMPFSYLPDSVKEDCKLVYITRDPKDTLVSLWPFFNKVLGNSNPLPLELAADNFCSGVIPFGPFHEHVLEYWEASKRLPEKVMFIKYEDLRRDPKPVVRKLAKFLGRPFDGGEKGERDVDKVIWRSSFDRLKGLDVNKNGKLFPVKVPFLTNNLFFRRGQVGDWQNHLTPEMAERIDDVTRVKFRGIGLYLDDDDAEDI